MRLIAAVLLTFFSNVAFAQSGLIPQNSVVAGPTAGGQGFPRARSLTAADLPFLGTGVGAALGTAVGSAGSVVLNGGALGTPSSGVGTNLTALNASNLASGTVPTAQLPAGQYPGTATNDNACTTCAGAFLSSNVIVASAVSLTTATPKDITTLTLTAGDWDVSGMCETQPTGGAVVTGFICAIGPTLNTLNTTVSDSSAFSLDSSTQAASANLSLATDTARISLAGSATYHLVAQATFASGTVGGFGKIRARRMR